SSHVDRFTFTDNSKLNVESLIENLKNMIMKKLFILCVTESSVFLSALSVSFSVTFPSQSSTPVSVSDSPAPATSASVSDSPASATSALSGSATSAFVISSSHFKEILHRLSELCFSRIIFSLNSVEII
ncbi:hypothetical protein BDDG_13680, partial [Blastomyces dermatitidis ATCC 18188]